MSITLIGLAAIRKALEKAGDGMVAAQAAALYQEGLDIIGKSVAITPKDTGRLRGSHYAAPPVKSGIGKLTGEIGFGTDYAVSVHEKKASHPVGQSKYLEVPVNAARSGFKARMARRTWLNWKRGIGVRAIPADAPKRPKGKR